MTQGLGQKNRSWLTWILVAAGVALVSVPVVSRLRGEHKVHPGEVAPAQVELPATDATKPDLTQLASTASNRLRDAGWPTAAARAVVDLNLEWFAIQAEENPGGYERQLKLLEALASHPKVFAAIEQHPEIAGLLAGSEAPERIAASLSVDSCDYDALAGLFIQHADSRGRTALAMALLTQRSTIRHLQQRGVLGAELLFMYDRPPLVSAGSANWPQEYDRWLHDELEARRHVPHEELASFVNLAYQQGPEIRKRLADDETFRREFRTTIWPRLNRAADENQKMFEVFLSDPRVWDLLRLDAGDELLRGTGLLAIDLLYGFPNDDRPAYPASVHPEVIQILLRREPMAIQALLEFRHEPLFVRILRKPISADARAAVLAKLFQARPNHAAVLAKYDGLSGKALAEEVGPPPHGLITWVPFYYTVYEVPKKWLQGRDATTMDLLQAALDPVMLVADVFTGGAAEVPRRAAVVAGREATEKLAEKLGEKALVVTLEKSAAELAAQKLTAEVAEKLATKGGEVLGDWSITALLTETQRAVSSALGELATIDITNMCQFLHRYGGLSRRTMKDWFGLEARLFMRGDAKVFLAVHNVPRRLLGAKAAEFLARTANDLMIGAAVESEPGQDTLRQAVKTAVAMKQRGADTLRSWRQHVSALWLLQASQSPTTTAP